MQLFHLLLQFSVFSGFFLPFGEALGPWVLMKIVRPKDLARQEAGKRLVAFQGSWIIYRFIIILLTGALWLTSFSAQQREISPAPPIAAPSEEFSIPGEPGPAPPDEEYSTMNPREDAREFREWLDDIKGNPELLFIQSIFNQPMVIFWTAFAFVILVLMWLFTTLITLLNILVILRDGRPWYPLTLPWLKAKKTEAGLSPASAKDSIANS